jgi:hypothetical protein
MRRQKLKLLRGTALAPVPEWPFMGTPMLQPRVPAHPRDPWRRTGIGILILAAGFAALARASFAVDLPPLQVDILDAQQRKMGRADVYLNYVELRDAAGQQRGAIGVVMIEGQARLFLVQRDGERKLVGWAENHKLFNSESKLIGYYNWTAIWSYVYDDKLKKVGQAQCIAYQGVCAAGIAGYLLGLY